MPRRPLPDPWNPAEHKLLARLRTWDGHTVGTDFAGAYDPRKKQA
jgi:hypothetical protein